jgi:PleD family two-component response regulator
VRENRLKGLVLIIDGDESSLMRSVHQIRSRSFTVVAALALHEALVILATSEPDAIVTTVTIDGKPDGFELFNLVRCDPERAHIPFIFVAPEFDRTTLLVGRRLGVDDFLTEPLDYEMLCAIIEGKKLNRMIPGRV